MDFVNYLPLDFGEYSPRELIDFLKVSNISPFWQKWLDRFPDQFTSSHNTWTFIYDAYGVRLKNTLYSHSTKGISIGNREPNKILNDIILKLSRHCPAGVPLQLIDATAGLLNDTQSLLHLNMSVTSYESNPLLALLIFVDTQLKTHAPQLRKHWQFYPLTFNESILQSCEKISYKILLYDPMFEQQEHKTLPSKEMQILSQLTQEFPQHLPKKEEWENWLAGVKAIVVKRPNKSDYLFGQAPQYSIKSKLLRWDIYSSNLMGITVP